ncbi:hypothetical protein D4A47_11775 [Anaerotruncus massiliensis (ex Liu et al. 2021)]|uniref:Uncharacterized protein n=1 Tax=Anaerotruncus massiliensis (ex Liu et al. 2021) TaxID=2321404 RepID=A0A498CKE2_9FIRM|nr:hypothetical protein D4A47_11775 [Anaerotruncus massiliensis (ex Liu et al. 2021)]
MRRKQPPLLPPLRTPPRTPPAPPAARAGPARIRPAQAGGPRTVPPRGQRSFSFRFPQSNPI